MQIVSIPNEDRHSLSEVIAERTKSRNATSEIKSREMKHSRQKRMHEQTFFAERKLSIRRLQSSQNEKPRLFVPLMG